MEIGTTALLVRGVLALLLIVGGIVALFLGNKLYRDGIGLAPDGSVIKTSTGKFDIKLSLKTVGSVVMITSVAWGFFGYLTSPELRRSPTDLEISQLIGPEIAKVASRGLAASLGGRENVRQDPQVLIEAFNAAADAARLLSPFGTIEAVAVGEGDYGVATSVESVTSLAGMHSFDIVYSPSVAGDLVTFTPSAISLRAANSPAYDNALSNYRALLDSISRVRDTAQATP